MRNPRRHDPLATTARVVLASALLTGTLASMSPSHVAARQRESGNPVAATERFVLYSRFPFNLTDGLLRAALGVQTPGSECLQTLSSEEREAWDRAVEGYRELFIDSDDGRRRAIFLRLNLAGLGDQVRGGLEPTPEEVELILEAGAYAYRACWWEEDDAANRRWIENLVPMLREVGDVVATRIADAYQTPWHGGRIPVDAVPYVSRQGANTIRPAHVLVGSSHGKNGGRASLEAIFHEASHTIIGPRGGEPIRRVREAAERLGVEVPEDLWHVVLFYTTGEVVRRVIAESYGEQYDPYLYATDLFERAWPELREPVEEWWQPYLDGKISMSEAAEGMLRALSGARTGARGAVYSGSTG